MKKLVMTIMVMMMLLAGMVLVQGCGEAGLREIKTNPAKRRELYISSHPEIDGSVAACILAGKYCLGMTTDEFRASMGWPYKSSRTVNYWRTQELWEYRWVNKTCYFYFKNNVLTGWQD